MVSSGLALLVAAVCVAALPGHDCFLTAFGKQCPEEKFDCRNGECVSGSVWCDGFDNCGNNADERDCRVCLSGSLKCKASNQCVPSGARCNGKIECEDQTDELGCERAEQPPKPNGAPNLVPLTALLLPPVFLCMMGRIN